MMSQPNFGIPPAGSSAQSVKRRWYFEYWALSSARESASPSASTHLPPLSHKPDSGCPERKLHFPPAGFEYPVSSVALRVRVDGLYLSAEVTRYVVGASSPVMDPIRVHVPLAPSLHCIAHADSPVRPSQLCSGAPPIVMREQMLRLHEPRSHTLDPREPTPRITPCSHDSVLFLTVPSRHPSIPGCTCAPPRTVQTPECWHSDSAPQTVVLLFHEQSVLQHCPNTDERGEQNMPGLSAAAALMHWLPESPETQQVSVVPTAPPSQISSYLHTCHKSHT